MTGSIAHDRAGHEPPRSLFWRLVSLNALVLLLAAAALALSPVTVSSPVALEEAGVLLGGLLAMLVVTVLLTRRALAPLRALTDLMGDVDPLHPGRRIPVRHEIAEVDELTDAFNRMLDRLEEERRESSRRGLSSLEAERRHIAQELHDAVGQALTVVLLELDDAARHADADQRPRLSAAQEHIRAGILDTRRILAELRPEALDDLGLRSALITLIDRLVQSGAPPVYRHFGRELPGLSPEAELVVYRIAQEAMTNAIRHAGATRIDVHLERGARGIRLRVIDDGGGLNGTTRPGGGLRGMRERALMIGAELEVASLRGGGVEVRVDVEARP